MTPKFNESEISAIRLLAERRHAGNVEVTQFEIHELIGYDAAESLFDRLRVYDMSYWPNNVNIEATTILLEYVDRIDNPPTPDHLKSINVWWNSKRWSVLITTALKVLACIVLMITALKMTISWFGI